MESGRSSIAALTFPIIAVLCGKIKEQCLVEMGGGGKLQFSGERGERRTRGSAPDPRLNPSYKKGLRIPRTFKKLYLSICFLRFLKGGRRSPRSPINCNLNILKKHPCAYLQRPNDTRTNASIPTRWQLFCWGYYSINGEICQEVSIFRIYEPRYT